MSEKFVIKAEVRDERGKNEMGRLRRSGGLPMVVYGNAGEAIAVKARLSEVAAIIRSESGVNSVFTLQIEGKETCDVMFQARQIDPIRGRLKHADLVRVTSTQMVEMNVNVHLIEDVKSAENLSVVLHQLHVRCQSSKIPESIDIKVSEIPDSGVIHVSDLKLGEGIEILNDKSQIVISSGSISEKQLADSLVSQVDGATIIPEAAPTPEAPKEK
jgi:large subunit ribosomal protein L25